MNEASAALIFRALGDPTRLQMFQRLAPDRAINVSAVSANLSISRQGARKHLQVLVDANLVSLEPKGRDVLARPNLAALHQCSAYLAEMERRWDERLQSLRAYVERIEADKQVESSYQSNGEGDDGG